MITLPRLYSKSGI
uniref:Uncharacterized protein n=1 Tax=Anguilla anguilla TaxID=7936 RepID=A0A0E9TPB6_ANGAN